jgi:hypothetical protein
MLNAGSMVDTVHHLQGRQVTSAPLNLNTFWTTFARKLPITEQNITRELHRKTRDKNLKKQKNKTDT